VNSQVRTDVIVTLKRDLQRIFNYKKRYACQVDWT